MTEKPKNILEKPKNILDQIGGTPLVSINALNQNKDVEILAKLEYFNPGGSVKDRPALNMIEEAEKTGDLTKEKIILEARYRSCPCGGSERVSHPSHHVRGGQRGTGKDPQGLGGGNNIYPGSFRNGWGH